MSNILCNAMVILRYCITTHISRQHKNTKGTMVFSCSWTWFWLVGYNLLRIDIKLFWDGFMSGSVNDQLLCCTGNPRMYDLVNGFLQRNTFSTSISNHLIYSCCTCFTILPTFTGYNYWILIMVLFAEIIQEWRRTRMQWLKYLVSLVLCPFRIQ